MTHSTKTSIERSRARRNGSVWRQYLSAAPRTAGMVPGWARHAAYSLVSVGRKVQAISTAPGEVARDLVD